MVNKFFFTFSLLLITSVNIFCTPVNTDIQCAYQSCNHNMQDTDTVKKSNDLKPLHSPKKATVLSTVLPGAGQIYNKQAWKVPVIYSAFAVVTYFAVTNGNNRIKFKDEYYNRINNRTDLLLKDYTSYTDEGIYNLYNAYKSNFQLSLIIGAAFYTLQILDAYVYGHLFNFDLSDDITLNVLPDIRLQNPLISQNRLSYGLSLSITLHH